uniref:Uncharacterized protein n=1 Tax=Timema tahoe TaxID=61484 RepID=A0A7R9IG61_9NEOP|nr:unnamed protein product [Timema tahoe]
MSVRLRLDDIQSAKKSKERSCCLQTESSSSLENNFEAISPVLGSNTRGMEDCPDTSELFEHHNNNGRYSFPKRAMVDLEFVGVTYSVRTFSRQKLRLVICWGLRGTCRWRKSHLDMLLLTRLSGDARRARMMIWTDGGRSHSRGSQTFKTEGDLGP